MTSPGLRWIIAVMCIPVLVISAGEQNIEIRPKTEVIGTNPFLLTSPGYPAYTLTEQLTCKLNAIPEHGTLTNAYTFNVQIQDFAGHHPPTWYLLSPQYNYFNRTISYSQFPSSRRCMQMLTLVNLLGDEMELFSSCSKSPNESFANESFANEPFALSSHGMPKDNGAVQLVYRNELTSEFKNIPRGGRFKLKVEVHKANGYALPKIGIHVVYTQSKFQLARLDIPFPVPGYRVFRDENKLAPTVFMFLSPGWPKDFDMNKFMCELQYQPPEDEDNVNAKIRYNIWIEQSYSTPECGYELFMLNMLRDGTILEAPTRCEKLNHKDPLISKPAFIAPHGLVKIVVQKVKENATGAFCLVLQLRRVWNGNSSEYHKVRHPVPGRVNISCYPMCITPEINNGYFDCTPASNGSLRTCAVKCMRGFFLKTGFNEQYICDGDDWKPDISSDFLSNVCEPSRQNIEIRPNVEFIGTSPFILTSPGYPVNTPIAELACKLNIEPEHGPSTDANTLKVEILDFAGFNHTSARCPRTLTFVNLLGDEMELFSSCSNPNESFTLSSHGIAKASASVQLVYKNVIDKFTGNEHRGGRFKLKIEVHNAYGHAVNLLGIGIRVLCTESEYFRSYMGELNESEDYNIFQDGNKLVSSDFNLYSPSWPGDTNINKLICELKYLPNETDVNETVVFHIKIQSLNNNAECGYELFLLNMLRDDTVLQAPTYCANIYLDFTSKPAFIAPHGLLKIVYQKVVENATDKFFLRIKLRRGETWHDRLADRNRHHNTLSPGKVNISCYPMCITPEIDNGYFDCMPASNGSLRTCVAQCYTGYSFQMEFNETYTCEGDDWSPDVSSDFLSNACKPCNDTYDSNCTSAITAQLKDDDKALPQERIIPASRAAPEQENRLAWITVGSVVFIAMMVIVVVVIHYVARSRTRQHPNNNRPLTVREPATAMMESTTTMDT